MWKKALFLIALAVFLVLAVGVIVTIGPMPITVVEVYGILLNTIIPDVISVTKSMENVVLQIRLPRIMGAIIVGFGLAACGCVMQAV
jgi:iron complex transport system permease protein